MQNRHLVILVVLAHMVEDLVVDMRVVTVALAVKQGATVVLAMEVVMIPQLVIAQDSMAVEVPIVVVVVVVLADTTHMGDRMA